MKGPGQVSLQSIDFLTTVPDGMRPDKWISAPAKAGKSGRRRWVTILEISEDRRFAKVKNSHPRHPPWWTRLASLRNRAGHPIEIT